MILDNLSLSQLQSCLFEEEHFLDGSLEAGVPSNALETIEAMNCDDE